MGTHIVIDGNAFYEVDEECLKRLASKEAGRKVKGMGNSRENQPAAYQKSRPESVKKTSRRRDLGL